MEHRAKQSPVQIYFLFGGDELIIWYFFGRGSGIVHHGVQWVGGIAGHMETLFDDLTYGNRKN